MKDLLARAAVIALLYACLAAISVQWVYRASPVGMSTEYQREHHQAAIEGAEPTTNQYRFSIFFLAEGVRRVTGFSVEKTYLALRLADLFLSACLLHGYLRTWVGLPLAALGILFYFAVSPLLYAYHVFHPYDQPSFILHIVAFRLIHARRDLALAAVAMLGMTVRETFVILPVLYFLYRIGERGKPRVVAFSLLLTALLAGVYLAIRWHYGPREGFQRWLLPANIAFLRDNWVFYPVVLFFSVLLVLSWINLRRRDRFLQSALAYAGLLLAIHAVATHFHEVRCYGPVLLALLPLSLLSVQDYLTRRPSMHRGRITAKPPAAPAHDTPVSKRT